ncbi:MAG: protoporphyrinogen oxidase [Thermoguttaceae bacterium]
MNDAQNTPRRVAVIGGGISGLAAAHRLVELDPTCEVRLFEAGSRLGGVISTVHEDGFQVEQSADNFITTFPWGLDLCERLGLTDQLVQTNPAHRQTYVVHNGKLYKLPDGFLMMAPTRMWPLAVTPVLSPLGKLRAAMEYFIPPHMDEADESMASFVCRRLGREAFDRLVEPLVGAVYAADMNKLSVNATLPRFRQMEREHGSLIKAMRKNMKAQSKGKGSKGKGPKAKAESGARYSMFVTLREGLTCLIDAMAARLPEAAVQLNSPVERIERSENGWLVSAKGVEDPTPFDGLIIATPSGTSARLLSPIDADLGNDLGSICHSGTAIVSLGYDRDQVGHSLDGMGAVVPKIENSPILACSFSSQKYTHRAPEGKVLLRVFVGGANREEMAEMPDEQLRPLVTKHLEGLLKVRGEPCYCNIAHWPGTMPQYHVGHKELVARIFAGVEKIDGVELAGNAFRGVGLPDCIHGGETAAERVLGQAD